MTYLALRGTRPSRRDALARLLWTDVDAAQGRHSLRQAVSALRALGAGEAAPFILTDADMVTLNLEAVEVDAVLFTTLANSHAIEHQRGAAALYAGELLEGSEHTGTAFDAWLAGERARFHHVALGVFSRLLQAAVDAGRTDEAIDVALRLLRIEPLQEWVHRALIRLYQSQGRLGAALAQYNVCASTLQQQLNVEPEEETRRLCQQILAERSRRAPARVEKRLRLPEPADGTSTVVVCDVTPVTHALIEQILRPAGYSVVAAESVADVVEMIPKLGHAAILSGADGLSGRSRLLSTLRQRDAEVPVVFITADVPGTLANDERGRVGYVRQPIRPNVLLERLEDMLHQPAD